MRRTHQEEAVCGYQRKTFLIAEGHQRKKELGDRANGHTVAAGTVHLKKILDQNLNICFECLCV